jgi:hypothetical protein
LFTMLIVSVDATSSALHTPFSIPVKGASPDNTSPGNNPQHAQYIFTKENELNIDVDTSSIAIETKYTTAFNRLKKQASLIKEYARVNNFSAEYCFLVDMSLPSGKKRFFVYNMRKDSLEFSALVAHGFGSTQKDCEDQLAFSNMPYSFKTSLGKYKIGQPYNGAYGLSYKLYGLDSTNNRAFERAIVLHSDKHVPENETFPGKIFQSAGCPTVTPSFLPILGSFIKSSKKPILMWIYS